MRMERVKQLISDYLPALIELLRNVECRAQHDLKPRNAVFLYICWLVSSQLKSLNLGRGTRVFLFLLF